MRIVRKFQQGGPMPEQGPDEMQGGAPEEGGYPEEGAEGGAPEEGGAPGQGGEDPLMQIAQIFAQGLQSQDCQALAQGAQMFLQLLQQSAGPQGGPEGGQAQQGEPVFRKGGKIVGRKKCR